MMLKRLPSFKIFTTVLLGSVLVSSSYHSQAESLPKAMETTKKDELPAELLQISSTDAFAKYVFLVDKTQRKLLIYERAGESLHLLEELPTDIGKKSGNKTKRDDHRTPEGIYFLTNKLKAPEIPFSQYGSIAYTTNYPNLFDQLNGKTGSGIWLHAIPDTVPLTRGSKGCVVVRNEEIKKLGKYIQLKETPLIIYDSLTFVPKEQHDQKRIEMTNYFEGWRQAWEAQDFEKYKEYYDPRFTAPGFKYNSWIAHKSNLKSKYKYIKVTFSQPFMLIHKNELIVKTLQKYESDQHTDYGVKMIYALKNESGQYKIVREEWTEAKEDGSLMSAATQADTSSTN